MSTPSMDLLSLEGGGRLFFQQGPVQQQHRSVSHGPRSEYTWRRLVTAICHQAGPPGPPAGLRCQRLSVLSCALRGATLPPSPQSHLPTPPSFYANRNEPCPWHGTQTLPCDPMLCLEASGHRTDPAGQSGPGPQSQESCVSRDAFGRGAAFGGTPLVRKAAAPLTNTAF